MKRLAKFIFLFIFLFVLFSNNVSNAAPISDYVNPIGSNIDVSFGTTDVVAQNVFGSIAYSLISKVMGIIGILVLCMFVWAGLQYIMARGDSSKVKKANEVMKWSVIGLTIVFTSYVIINFIFTIIGNLRQ